MMSRLDPERTRGAILDAARALLENDGYHAVGLSAVAKAAGVSRQAIYLHFGSKANLLQALVDSLNDTHVFPVYQRIDLWGSACALDALDAWVEVVAATTPSLLSIANAVDAARRSDPEAEAIWQGPSRGRYSDCLRIVQWLATDGTLAPGWNIPDAARFLWASTSIRVFEDLTTHGWSRRRFIEHLQRSLRAALTAGTRDSSRRSN